MTEPSVTELIEKLTESEKKISEYEIKIKDFENTVTEKDKILSEKETEISKLQSILAKNFIASKEQPNNKDNPSSYADAYNKMIKDNLNKKE